MDLWTVAVLDPGHPAHEKHPPWPAHADRITFSSTLNDHEGIWMAADLPDWTIAAESKG